MKSCPDPTSPCVEGTDANNLESPAFLPTYGWSVKSSQQAELEHLLPFLTKFSWDLVTLPCRYYDEKSLRMIHPHLQKNMGSLIGLL